MGILEWLRNNGLINLNINIAPNLKHIHFLSDNQIKDAYKVEQSRDSKTLLIKVNQEKLNSDPEAKLAIQGIMKAAHSDSGGLLEASTDELFDDLNSELDSKEHKVLVEKLRKIVPESDIIIWEAALYIRTVHRENGSVRELRDGLILRHGERGRNISNICTGGYLESIIIPTYDELSANPDFEITSFRATHYETIVMKYPFAVFVSQGAPIESLLDDIANKIDYNKAYGISNLNIHAIGEINKKTVLNILGDDNVKTKFTREPKVITEGRVLIATIYF